MLGSQEDPPDEEMRAPVLVVQVSVGALRSASTS